MDRRIFGLENEYGVTCTLRGQRRLSPDEVARYLHSNTVREILVQALLDAPMFGLRFRWNAVTSLALPRFSGGSKVAPQLQRMKSEDLLAQVFPDQVACLENIVGDRQIPDHPLVDQTLHDCLFDAMDIDALVALLKRLESGNARIVHDKAKIKDLWSEAARVWFPKGPDDPQIALIAVEITDAEYWDSASSTMIYAYGYAKARLTGEPPSERALGENRKVSF